MKAAPITSDWTRRELLALKPPANITVSEWAERYRYLTSETTARPGKWSNELLPYLVEPMDTFSDRTVKSTTLIFCTQAGKSEVVLNVTGYTIDQDPGPILIVQPKDDNADTFCHRVGVMIDATDALTQHKTGRPRDMKTGGPLRLGSCTVYFAGAGSPSDLAERAIKLLLMDEVDKYPAWSGREANPLDLAEERTTTYLDAHVGKFTTPVLETDPGWASFQASDRRRYHVPCPHCRAYQVLEFSADRLKFPKDVRDPERIESERLAWYVCVHCGKDIEDTPDNLRVMLERGHWCPEGGKVTPRGKVKGGRQGPHRGYQLNALYSPFRGWSKVAAKFLRSKDDATALMNFTNSWLAQPWTETRKGMDEDELLMLRDERRAGMVPVREQLVLTAGVDMGGPENGPYVFDYVIRAWGPRLRSWLIVNGRTVGYKAELMAAIFGRGFVDGQGAEHRVQLALIDERYKPEVVREFCRGEEPHLFPLEGFETLRTPINVKEVDGLQVHQLDTNYLKNYLATLMGHPSDHPSAWSLHAQVDETYLRHMQTEHLVPARKRAVARHGGALKFVWRAKLGMGSPHSWDGEVYALAGAMRLGLHSLRDEGTVAAGDTPADAFHVARQEREDVMDPDSWLGAGFDHDELEGWLDE